MGGGGFGWGRRLAVAAPELQTYKVSQCESEPTSFPSTPFVLASQAPRRISPPVLFHDFTTDILVVWSGGGEKWQLWVENGKEIVEQMMSATFRQLLAAAAADKGQSG